MAIAPSSFGSIAGDLLVGNFGDGTVNIFDLSSDTFVGLLTDKNGNIITIDGLWALIAGNGGSAGNANANYFSTGPDGENHGLFGVIGAAPEPATLALLAGGLVGAAMRRRRKVA